MSTALSTASALVAHPYGWGWGPGPWVLIFPFLWFLFFVTVVVLVFRRRRAGWCGPGYGAGYGAGYGPGWSGAQRPGDPFQVLGDRYARGEIDDEEFRRRLEVLRREGQQT